MLFEVLKRFRDAPDLRHVLALEPHFPESYRDVPPAFHHLLKLDSVKICMFNFGNPTLSQAPKPDARWHMH